MTDFEMFSKHWNNAIYGLVGRVKQSSRPVLTNREINEMWREELLDNRFHAAGIPSEAKAFLTELYERRPAQARQLDEILSSSTLTAGLEAWQCAAKAAGALAAAALAFQGPKKKLMDTVRKTVAGAASLTLTGVTAADLLGASKDPLASAIVEEARRQLEACRPVLESPAAQAEAGPEEN